jgi:HPt (histidine-containing phosphotransfer) domain-containing protein
MANPPEIEAVVPSDLQDLVPVFLENRKKDLHSLTVAIAAGDFELVRRIGHRMKGSGRSYGFSAITALGMQMEERGKARDRDGVIKLLAKYRHYLDNVKIKYEAG